MMKDYLNKCPVCNANMVVTGYKCTECPTEVNGIFKGSKFSQLTEEELEFVEIFVMNRGSIKEVEKELGISYPTVRNKLDSIIQALGHTVKSEDSRLEILRMVDEGSITAEEASQMLKELKR